MTQVARAHTCREVVELLADHVAGGLGREQRLPVERHLGECRGCAAYLRSYAATIRLAREAHLDDPLPGGVPEPLVRSILEAHRCGP